jgi:sec-independent protein translocase protein TatB
VSDEKQAQEQLGPTPSPPPETPPQQKPTGTVFDRDAT